MNFHYWALADGAGNKFVFNEDIWVNTGEYIVLSRDSCAFRNHYGPNIKIAGNFKFGFGTEDIVILIAPDGVVHDIVNYSYKYPWPDNANGTGNSIELIHTSFDNSIAKNWKSSKNKSGTPGKANSQIVSVLLEEKSPKKPSLFPLPCNDKLTIQFHDSNIDIETIQLYNSNSQLIDLIGLIEINATKNLCIINTGLLISGSYFITYNTISGVPGKIIPFMAFH